MRHGGAAAALLAFLFTCGAATAHPSGFSNHRFNPPGQQPVTEAGITTFHIEHARCSDVDYGDGRGETDCKNGNIRSVLSFERRARMGEAVEYRLDIQLDPSFAYEGWRNAMAEGLLPNAWDSDLRIASWEGEFLHNFIYRISADSRKGIAFLGRTCQAPADFGKWVSFSMSVKWSGDEDGWIRVTCDDRLIYARENIATNQAPHCYLANQCEPGIAKNPRRINYVVGPVMQGAGDDWQETGRDGFFTPIQDGGITIRMRNLDVRGGAERYGARDREVISGLQAALNALGCDVGPVDGIAGRRTQAAVFTCRQFSAAETPAEWNLETAPVFLDLYTRPGVAALPPGAGPARPAFAISAWQSFARHDGTAPQIITDIDGEVTPDGGESFTFRFILIGSYRSGKIGGLEMLFQEDIGAAAAAALAACNNHRVEQWDDGSHHLVLGFAPTPTGYVHRDTSCVLEALPRAISGEVEFVLGHFGDIALAMTRSGSVDDVTHDGLRDMIGDAASGEFVITGEELTAPVRWVGAQPTSARRSSGSMNFASRMSRSKGFIM